MPKKKAESKRVNRIDVAASYFESFVSELEKIRESHKIPVNKRKRDEFLSFKSNAEVVADAG